MVRGKFDGTSINFDHSNGKGGVFGTTFFVVSDLKSFSSEGQDVQGGHELNFKVDRI